VERVLQHYTSSWGVDSVLIIGYSRGANFAPFVINRLSSGVRAHVSALGLLSPNRTASFEFHLLDLVRERSRPTDLPMLPEVEALSLPMLCIYGTEDHDSLCPLLPPGTARLVRQSGGHRLHDAGAIAKALSELIVKAAS